MLDTRGTHSLSPWELRGLVVVARLWHESQAVGRSGWQGEGTKLTYCW